MRLSLARISLAIGTLAVLFIVGCGDVERFPSTSLGLPPDAITDASLSYDQADGSALLTWTAPRTHGGTQGLRRYDLRFDYSEDFDWALAERVLTPPVPAEPGQEQSYRFRYPRRGRVLSVAVRAIDNSGNLSAQGNVAAFLVPGITLSGTAVAYLTGQVDNLVATLTSAEFEITTEPDSAGRWEFSDLPEAAVTLRIAGAGANPRVFPVEAGLTLTKPTHIDFKLIPYEGSVVYPSISLLTLFKEAVGVRGGNPVLRTWASRPVDVFIPEYVTPGGLDYRAAAIDAINRWIELTDIDLFRVVTAPPAIGVVMEFLSTAEMGTQIGVTTHTNSADGAPLRSDIDIVNSFENHIALHRVMMHELGHTIRLFHLPAGFLMYGGQPLPDDPTADEIWFVRLLSAIPDGSDMSVYREVDE